MTWPIANRSNTLTVDYHYLRRQVAKYMHGNYAHAVLDDEQNEEVDEIIDDGLRMYYFPPVLPLEFAMSAAHVHQWSFMRPTWRFTTEADQRRYPVPQDWEHPIGDLSFVDTANNFYTPIKFSSPSRLRSIEYQTNFTSFPQYAALEPGESAGEAAQTQVLVLHPIPDGQYDLACQYQAVAKRLTADHPYPLGGQIHGHAILASCLAAAEAKKNGGAQGPLYRSFLERLASNVVRDQQRGGDVLGYNGQGSAFVHGRGMVRQLNGLFYQDVTYQSGTYDGS